MRWLSFRYDLTSDEGHSTSPWMELGQWTRFEYNNYNFWEGNNIHWEHFYMGIFRCNQVLDNVPGIEMDEDEKKQVLAQAYFLRALWYFQINLLWEKGTLVTSVQDTGYTPENASEEQIWGQIEKDLTTAIQMNILPDRWNDANAGRVTAGALHALLGKAYMQQGKFAEAKTEFNYLISSNQWDLVPNWLDNFTHLNENNVEGVFEIQFDDTNKGGTGNELSMATGFQRTQFYAPAGIGWADGKARRWLVDEYLKEKRADGTNDLRLFNSILYRNVTNDFSDVTDSDLYYNRTITPAGWDALEWAAEDCFIRKYNTSYYRDYEDYFAPNNYRIIRYADILLNQAECILETNGDINDAIDLIDQVRTRAGMTKLADSNVAAVRNSIQSRDALLKRLQMERTLELCFEGWRWADLKRWGLLDTQDGINELKERDPDFNNFVLDKHRRLPIPQIEVDNSGGKLTQNPRY